MTGLIFNGHAFERPRAATEGEKVKSWTCLFGGLGFLGVRFTGLGFRGFRVLGFRV